MKFPAVFTRLGFASFRFRSQRADYYEYLADIFKATEGKRTIKQIFQSDAARYGPKTNRGILSAHWAYRIEEDGDLAQAFSGTLPESDVRLIGMLQSLGGEALTDGLRDLAASVRLDEKISSIFRSTTFVGLLIGLLSLAMLAMIPILTVPKLQETFTNIDPALYRPFTKTLYGLSQWLTDYWFIAVFALITATVYFVWSIKNAYGPFRDWLDKHTAYGLYRDTQAIRVLVSIATIIKPRGSLNIGVRSALNMLSASSGPWLSSHLERMMDNLDNAITGAGTFNTGILDKQVYWYLEDLVDAVGLGIGLQKARSRLETRTLASVARRALILNWTLLILSIIFLIGVMVWHTQVLFELRSLMILTSM